MPTFDITSPDGKTYRVNAPEGATKDDALAFAQEQHGAKTDTAPPPDNRGPVDKLFGIGGERYQTWPERAVRGIGDTVMGGAEMMKKGMEGGYGDPRSAEMDAAVIPDAVQASTLGLSAAPEAAKIAGGVVDAASKARQIRNELPTTEEIKKSSQAAYKAVEDGRLIASPESLNRLVSATHAGLDQRLMDENVAPRTFKALGQLEKSEGDLKGILSVRDRLGELKPKDGTDHEAALHVKDAIDNYIDTLPPEEVIQGDAPLTKALLDHARQSWKSFAQADQVQSALEIGEHKAAVSGVGANSQNAMRQRIREIVDSGKSRYYSDKAKKQLEDIFMGTWVTNAARKIGKFAPSGPVSALSTMNAALGGFMAGGTGTAAMMAGAVAIPATIAKYLGTYLTKGQIAELENILRSESPLGRATTSRVNSQPLGMTSQAASGATALVPALAATGGSPLGNSP
jgi:hypothetical protein